MNRQHRLQPTARTFLSNWWQRLMVALCGSTGCVVAFEPDPYARQGLVRNIPLNPHIVPPRVESFAVSAVKGEAILYSRGGNANSSLMLLFSTHPNSMSKKVFVHTVSLDEYLSEQKLPQPRWVKIDNEGAEIGILKGVQQLLASDSSALLP